MEQSDRLFRHFAILLVTGLADKGVVIIIIIILLLIFSLFLFLFLYYYYYYYYYYYLWLAYSPVNRSGSPQGF